MRSFARSLLAAVGIIAVLFGVPVALIAMAGWPLPTQMPDWDHVYWSARQGNIPAEFVIKTLACVVWLAWAQVAWALLWELAVNVPRAMRGRAGVSSPLVAAPASRLARRLVTAAMVLTAIASTPASTAAAPALSSIRSTSGPDQMPDRAATTLIVNARDTTTTPSTTPKAVWKVADGDTLWDIAEQSLGDGSRVDEILRSNPYLVASRPLRAGQQIELPEGAHIPADRSGSSPSHWAARQPPTDEFGSDVRDDAVHVVTPGDTMWGIIEDHYGHVNQAIVLDVAAANEISDPSLIFPGQSISLPSRLAASDEVSTSTASGDTHVVAPGDTLWDIIETHYGHADADVVWRVAAANGLENPALIFPGQSITFPSDDAPATAPAVSDETASTLPRADDAAPDAVPPRPDSSPATNAGPTSSEPRVVVSAPTTILDDIGPTSNARPVPDVLENRPGREAGADATSPERDGSDDLAEVERHRFVVRVRLADRVGEPAGWVLAARGPGCDASTPTYSSHGRDGGRGASRVPTFDIGGHGPRGDAPVGRNGTGRHPERPPAIADPPLPSRSAIPQQSGLCRSPVTGLRYCSPSLSLCRPRAGPRWMAGTHGCT